MNAWKEYYLSEFLELNPKVETLNTRDYSFVEMPDLEPGRKYVFPSRKRKPNGLTKFQNGDTLFAKITPCLENGKICQVHGLEDNIGVGSTEFFVFRGKENVSDNDFVHYLLKWYPVKKYAEKNMSGSAGHQRVPIDCLHKLKLLLPPYDENKKIGYLLSGLDTKIDNLYQQNQTLEKIVQTLFKQWFIDFNFPNENGKPYKDNGGEMIGSELGEIPKDWQVEQLGKALEVKRGGSPRPIKDYISDSGYKWLKISDATASRSPFIFKIKEHIRIEGLNKTTLISAGSLVLSNSATPGIPKFLGVDSCIHDGWLHFPKTSIFSYQYLYLFFKHIRKPLLQQGNGSVFKNLKTDILKSWDMVVPGTETMVNFDELISTIFEKIRKNTIQIQTLSKTRDTLLPKFMSGQVRIKD